MFVRFVILKNNKPCVSVNARETTYGAAVNASFRESAQLHLHSAPAGEPGRRLTSTPPPLPSPGRKYQTLTLQGRPPHQGANLTGSEGQLQPEGPTEFLQQEPSP